jgi:hypothetical protein
MQYIGVYECNMLGYTYALYRDIHVQNAGTYVCNIWGRTYAIYRYVHMQSPNFNCACSCVVCISHVNLSFFIAHKLYVSLMKVK